LEREGTVRRGGEAWSVRLAKKVEIGKDQPGMTVSYTLTNLSDRPYEGTFGSEWNFGLLAGWADDRYYLVNGRRGPGDMRLGTSGEHEQVGEIAVIDHWQEVDIRVAPSKKARVWRYAVETASLSEGGYEKTYQASAVFPHWRIVLPAGGTWSVTVAVNVRQPVWHPPES
jgi:alpha-amylase